MPFDPFAATYVPGYAHFNALYKTSPGYGDVFSARERAKLNYSSEATWREIQDEYRWQLFSKKVAAGGWNPGTKLNSPRGSMLARARSKVSNMLGDAFGAEAQGRFDNFFSDEGDGGYARETVTRRGPTRGARRNTTEPPGKRGFFSPPKRTTPNAPREDRLGVMGKQSNGRAGGGWTASHNRSGVPGMNGSYEMRSAQRLAQNLKSRIRLTEAGFIAIIASDVGNDYVSDMNKRLIDKHGYGIAHASAGSAEAKLAGDDPAKVIRRNISYIPEIGRGLVNLGAALSPYLPESTELSIYQGMQRGKVVLDGWVEGGAAGYYNARTMLRAYGSSEMMAMELEREAAAQERKKKENRFFSDVSNEIAGEIAGVSGADVLDGLMRINDDNGIGHKMRQLYKNQNRYGRSSVVRPDPSTKSRLGTRD